MPPRLRHQPPPSPGLLRIDEVAARLRCSKRTIQRWARLGRLPQPLRLSPQKMFWRAADIQAIIDGTKPVA